MSEDKNAPLYNVQIIDATGAWLTTVYRVPRETVEAIVVGVLLDTPAGAGMRGLVDTKGYLRVCVERAEP